MNPRFIKREEQTTDQTTPWAGIAFFHGVDSDELADDLRIAYPKHQTLPQRKLAAVIDFFEHELREMQSGNNILVSTKTPPTVELASMESTTPNIRQKVHNEIRPNDSMLSSLSPVSSVSSTAAYRDSKRRCTAAAVPPSFVDPTLAASSTQFVFNALDGRTMRQKTKRRMTDEERLEYKETRRRGACAKCKRQKGKCTHMDDAETTLGGAQLVTERSKKRTPFESDASDTKPSKTLRLEHTMDAYSRVSMEQQENRLQQSRRGSYAPEQHPPSSTEPHWPIEAEPRLDMLGYVNQPPSFEQVQDPFTNDRIAPYWTGHNNYDVDSTDLTDSFQSGRNSQRRVAFPASPTSYVHELDPEAFDPSGYPPCNLWDQSQPPLPGSAGIT